MAKVTKQTPQAGRKGAGLEGNLFYEGAKALQRGLDALNKPTRKKARRKAEQTKQTPQAEAGPFVQILSSLVSGVTDAYDPKTATAARLLTALDDQKAMFGMQGYDGVFRYYSAAHPDYPQQGMPVMTDDYRKGVTATPMPINKKGIGFTPFPVSVTGGPPPPAQFSEINVRFGIPIAPGKVVSTDEIQTLVLANMNYSYEANIVGAGEVITTPRNEDLLQATNSYYAKALGWDDVRAAHDLLVSRCATAFPSLLIPRFAALQLPLGIGSERNFETISAQVGLSPSVWVLSVRLYCAELVAGLLGGFFSGGITPGESLALNNILGKSVYCVTLPRKFAKQKPRSFRGQIPVIPVSDDRGYEVIGSYRYGRGLNIEPNSTFDEIMRADPLRSLSPREVNTLLSSVQRVPTEGYPNGKVKFRSNEQALKFAAALAAKGVTVLRNPDGSAVKPTIGSGWGGDPKTLRARLEDWATTALDGVDQVPVSNAALTLSQVSGSADPHGYCVCGSAAVRGLFDQPTELLEPDQINRYLAGELEESAVRWSAQKERLAGNRGPAQAIALDRSFDRAVEDKL